MLGAVSAVAASDATEFFTNLFTGVKDGDPLALVVVGIVVLIVLRFVLARWMWRLIKQTFIFGGLGYGVYFTSQAVSDRWGSTAGNALLVGGFAILGVLFFAMLYVFFLRRAREKEAAQRAEAKGGEAPSAPGQAPVASTGAPGPSAPRAEAAPAQPAAAPAVEEEHGRLEEMLKKVNVLGASKDQNLLTVMVLILVAEFGVFTSKTIAAPNAQIGMVLFGVFVLGAVVFVKTSYQNYWRGVTHFVFATVFALALAVLMLVYWQSTYCDPSMLTGNQTADPCPESATSAVTFAVAMNPNFFFASDGLIAAITAVAFSTLLTKGGG